MKQSDHKNLLNWFRSQRLIGEGWKKRHEIPQGQTEYGFFPPRSMDKTIRDVVKKGYLEGHLVPGKNLKEWRYVPESDQEQKVDLSNERDFSQNVLV